MAPNHQPASSWSSRDALMVAAGAGAAGLAIVAWRRAVASTGTTAKDSGERESESGDADPHQLGDPSVNGDPELAPLISEARRRARKALLGRARAPLPGVLAAVGGTPLLRVASLSEATGCEILAKAEMLAPGGSVKDRVAASIVREAVAAGALALPRKGARGTGGLISDDDDEDDDDDDDDDDEGDGDGNGGGALGEDKGDGDRPGEPRPFVPLLTEGTAGSTGVSLATVAAASGCRCFVALPDDAALEKSRLLRALGAGVARLRPVAIAHPEHPVHVARRAAEEECRRRGAAVVASAASAAAARGPGGGDRPRAAGAPCAKAAAAAAAAAGRGAALFADQFENPANWHAHLQTGEEVWMQAAGAQRARPRKRGPRITGAQAPPPPPTLPPPPPPPRVDAFVSGAGTGGTLAGASLALKSRDARVRAVLVDVAGSSLYNRVKRGVAYSSGEAEGARLRHPFDTATEGVGLNRLTANFCRARVDGAVRCSDREAARMAAHVLRHDGLFVGSSAAVNLVGAVKVARRFRGGGGGGQRGGGGGEGGRADEGTRGRGRGRGGRRPVIATLLCDGGARHLSKFHCPEYLAALGLDVSGETWGRTDLSWVEED